jgi:hypothetical protein
MALAGKEVEPAPTPIVAFGSASDTDGAEPSRWGIGSSLELESVPGWE